MNSNLEVLMSAIGLAALVSTPVLAKQRAHNGHPAPAQSSISSAVVSAEGRVIGADPDPAIRFEIQRDWPSANN
jgi:hypothetical protein